MPSNSNLINNRMAQNKTTLILNNLVELTYPLKSSKQIQISCQGNLISCSLDVTHLKIFRLKSVNRVDSGAAVPSSIAKS
jgi:hypothetical protein